MKIVHLSTYDAGGAAVSAWRLHQALLEKGVDSSFVCLYRFTDRKVLQFPDRSTWWRKLRIRWYRWKFRAVLSQSFNQFERVSIPVSIYDVLSHRTVSEADIINLHWIADFVDYSSFFKHCKNNVVWTLHDLNPTLGFVHYKGDLPRDSQLLKLELQIARQKKKLLGFCKKLHIVGPSSWILEEALNSGQLPARTFRKIHYGVDTKVFRPQPKEVSRAKFGLDPSKLVFAFVSQNVHNERKGFSILKQAIEILRKEKIACELLVLGESSPRESTEEGFSFTGYLQKEDEVCVALSAADAFILPSLEDNLPNVMLEALMVGIPVIGLPAGGIKETIIPGFNGEVAKGFSHQSLFTCLKNFAFEAESYNHSHIREWAIDHFSADMQAKRYLHLYKELVSD